MIVQNDNCLICMHAISNPICKSCHLQEIEYWMKDLKFDYNQRKKVLSSIKEKIPLANFEANSTCIICKKNEIDICSYCLFYISLRVITSMSFGYEIIEDFLQTFNYQLGYARYPLEREFDIV